VVIHKQITNKTMFTKWFENNFQRHKDISFSE